MVKNLRERTGAGMMECKGALVATTGDMDAAVELLRKRGAASADKRAGRTAAEGVIASFINENRNIGVLVEVNCETDFVAKEAGFKQYCSQIATCVAAHRPAGTAELLELPLVDGRTETVDAARLELVGRIGEKIEIRRFTLLQAQADAVLSAYVHGVRIGVLVETMGGRTDLGRELAMHVAASTPLCVSADDVPQEMILKEKEIYLAQAKQTGKPDQIIEKMVSGRVRKYVDGISLLGQPFVKDPERTVGELLQSEDAKVTNFVRFEVGEGMTPRDPDDFVAEVMAQVKRD